MSVLNCSNNELVSIENLPKSITELHCDNNNIIAIDLMDLSELGKLSIKENSDNLNILNVPRL
jgi:Leucine-rich repeat (LRR) protein